VSDADLQSLDANIVALTAKVQSLQQSCRHMETGRSLQGAHGFRLNLEVRNHLSEWVTHWCSILLQLRSLCWAALGITLKEMQAASGSSGL
jgi:hypothetical protein